jgi:hypothetical protein
MEVSSTDEVHFQLDRIFNFMPLIFRSARGGDMEATYLFNMEGEGGGQWAIQIAGGKAETGSAPELDIEAHRRIWIDLTNNDLNAM